MTQIDFRALINDLAAGHAKMVRTGMQATEDRFRPAIHTLEQEFFAAQIDPETKMKTSLQVAIMNVLALLPSPITGKVVDYADMKMKQEQLQRHEGRPDHYMTTFCTPLRAGS